ncbi:MAG TPA: putative transporter [Tepidisphaeraceae bacterium]|nr:putative transporter [Tepidisphaeraceae bacterium]
MPPLASLFKSFPSDSVPVGLAILSLAVTIGLAIGAIRVRGVRLGVAGVLFAALGFGQMGLSVDAKVLQFLRDFALILYMYTIGLQVGPGFVASLRAEGLRLNLLAVATLVLGAIMSWAVGHALPRATAPGVYAGAFTTTPGLAAAQEAFRRAPSLNGAGEDFAARAGLAYSITYPFGVVGPVLVIIALRRVFAIKIDEERKLLTAEEERRRPPIEVVDFEVTEPSHAGHFLRDHPLLREHTIVLSRMLRDHVLSVPTAETKVQVGDIYRAVGKRTHVERVVSAMGRRSDKDLGEISGDIKRVEMVVTNPQVLRRPLRELDLIRRTGVTIARVTRAGINLVPTASLRVAFADRVIAVGPEAGLKMVEAELGNSVETLNRPQLIPIFLGIVLGVIVGSIPFTIPGLNTTLRIGLAGGPLLAAIALSQMGNIGSVIWYMPAAANQLFRDFGLAVFLACVGLQAGANFVQRATTGTGLGLLLAGAAVTLLPVFVVGCYCRLFLKMNFITLSGWVAGAMTNTTSLMFADELAKNESPAITYAAIAPLATLVPIICSQVLAIVVLH